MIHLKNPGQIMEMLFTSKNSVANDNELQHLYEYLLTLKEKENFRLVEKCDWKSSLKNKL
jgi:hypothetical protein